jgi:hypothetical protein
MKMTTASLTEIATSFAREFAGLYSMPELATAKFVSEEGHDDSNPEVVFRGELAPVGQMAFAVRALSVIVRVCPCEVKDVAFAVVSIAYRHHGGGSNGTSREFFLHLNNSYNMPTYDGHVDKHVFNRVRARMERSNA